MPDSPKLTPDAMEFARFIANATPQGGLAVSNAILLAADIVATDMLSTEREHPWPNQRTYTYADEDYNADASLLKGLFPFVCALSPQAADDYAMKFPFLWEEETPHDAAS